MDAEHRHRLLAAVCDSLDPARDDTDDPLRSFLPLRLHAKVLDDSALIVEGERGTGKTALFRLGADLL